MNSSTGSHVRALAARILDAVLHQGRSLKAELGAHLPTLPDPRDRALVESICFAVLRQPARYQAALDAWIPRPLGKRDQPLRALLFVGFAQLDPLGLPAHAAVAETVEAARLLGRRHQAGLVNALLRRAQREGVPVAEMQAHWPRWLRERISADWPEDSEAIFHAGATTPPMWLRVNRRVQSRDAYLARLDAAGISYAIDPGLSDAVRLDVPVAVAVLPGFAEGAVSIQDASAQRVADALELPAGARVVDACAAPGGKAAHLLEREPDLRLTALDIDAARLQRVHDGLRRVGLADRARLVAGDASQVQAWWDGEPVDAVLLDAPCSATGIVRRQPDVLLHRRASDLTTLTAVQAQLLDTLWTTVAPGGVLLYATCSILHTENAEQVAAFLVRTPDAVLDPLDARFGRPVSVDGRYAGHQRLPGEGGGDGFFYARIRRAGRPAG